MLTRFMRNAEERTGMTSDDWLQAESEIFQQEKRRPKPII